MNKTTLVLAAAALLAACASGPEVVSAEPDSIRLAWRRGQDSEQLVRGLALRYCNGRPIEEVTQENSVGPFSRAKTWKCLGA